jgi:hypothetical protein
MVNETDPNGDAKLKENFSKLFEWLSQNHTKVDLEKAIVTLAQALAEDGVEKKE